MDGIEESTSFSPDGLTEQAVDALLTEVDAAVDAGTRPTSALMDGSAAERRRRRMQRRAVASVVRALSAEVAVAGPDGWAA